MELCIECKKQPIVVKKWSLCTSCYGKMFRNSRALVMKTPTLGKDYRVGLEREFQFVRNFFDHKEWIRHPALFYLDDDMRDRYTPDFYDAKRQVFIEVAATRQAWNQRKPILKKAIDRFPTIKFEARSIEGEFIPLDGRVEWNGAEASLNRDKEIKGSTLEESDARS